ncbi:MAG: hypothetical protein H2055_02160 [Sphingopyxis sp.]|nr:hypothetical protein [Sphingopyxis sp.]
MSNDDIPRGPRGHTRTEGADTGKTPGSLPPADVEDRENVGQVRPEDYPPDERGVPDPAAANRGHRPGKGSGPVSGSGAGAGGKGNAEDYDGDPQGGGGEWPRTTDRGPKIWADAPVGGSH